MPGLIAGDFVAAQAPCSAMFRRGVLLRQF
jgi:hypothetical protein